MSFTNQAGRARPIQKETGSSLPKRDKEADVLQLRMRRVMRSSVQPMMFASPPTITVPCAPHEASR